MRRLFLMIALAASPQIATGQEYAVGDIVVSRVVAKETPAAAMTGAGYLTMTNTGAESDWLIAVEADFPRVETHDTIVENDVARMMHQDEIEIAAGETVTFAPGGLHVMFMGLDGDPFEVGETIPATLIFRNSGSLDIVFDVKTMEDITAGVGHDSTGHGSH